jgi:hypothetical protein
MVDCFLRSDEQMDWANLRGTSQGYYVLKKEQNGKQVPKWQNQKWQ